MTRDRGPFTSLHKQPVGLALLQWDPYRMSSERHLVQPLWGQQALVGGAPVPQAWAWPTVRRGHLPSRPDKPARRPVIGT